MCEMLYLLTQEAQLLLLFTLGPTELGQTPDTWSRYHRPGERNSSFPFHELFMYRKRKEGASITRHTHTASIKLKPTSQPFH